MVHQVSQAHDAEANTPGFERRVSQLWHAGHVSIPVYNVIQEFGGAFNALLQTLPVYFAVLAQVLC